MSSDAAPIPLEATVLSIEIQNKNPIELIHLTNSFLSLGEEYKKFVADHPEFGEPPNVRLFVREITTGSVKAQLIAFLTETSQTLLPLVAQSNSLIGFSKYLKAAYDYFTGKSKEKPQLQKVQYEHLATIVDPVARDNGSQFNATTTINGNVYLTINVSSHEANEVQNVIGRELLQLQEPERKPHNKVVLYWYQAKDDPKSRTGDRGVIESIRNSPVKIAFEDDRIKDAMLHGLENPFRSAYIVDVEVETINERPVLYKILRFHDRFDKPEPESGSPSED